MKKFILSTALFMLLAAMFVGFASCEIESPLTSSGLASNGYHWIQNNDTYTVKFGERTVKMENKTGYWVTVSDEDLKNLASNCVYWAPYFTVMQDSAKHGISVPNENTVITNTWNGSDGWYGCSFEDNDQYNPTEIIIKLYRA